MSLLKSLSVVALLSLPMLAFADEEVTRCNAGHFVRLNGTELRFTLLFFNNGDLAHSATIERITMRDYFGNVIHDSGPEIGIPHPRSMVFSPPFDITTVPPGATYSLSTTDLWGTDPVPGEPRAGIGVSATVKVSKRGKPSLFVVHARDAARDRVLNQTTQMFGLGAERSATEAKCFRVRDTGD